MPNQTRPPEEKGSLPSRSAEISGGTSRLIAAGAAYAAAELLIAIVIGRFFSWGRAEALLFLAPRPWLLILAATFAARWAIRRRFIFYASALLLAAFSQSLFLMALGAEEPWHEALRGLGAGLLLVAAIDLAMTLAARSLKRRGKRIAVAVIAIFFLLPGVLTPYERIVIGADRNPAAGKSELMMLTALPLVWGEKGPLDPSSSPAAAYKALQEEFAIRPLDFLAEDSLGRGNLLLVAQPRALTPAELVAFDAWVRRGGRALILTDPLLLWPSELPLGDVRRPPAIGLLGPLLTHWDLSLESPEQPRILLADIEVRNADRRLIMFGPGRFGATSESCRLGPIPQIAHCRMGKGKATLIADADLLHDRLWVGPGPAGLKRHGRISDNPLVLADYLDELAKNPRARAARPVEWLDRKAPVAPALAFAFIPLLIVSAPAAWDAYRRRRKI